MRKKEINIASNFEISMAGTLNLIKEIMKSNVNFGTDQQQTPNLSEAKSRERSDSGNKHRTPNTEPQTPNIQQHLP